MASATTGVTDRRFHFISGLPRSGSTLLGALLRQNPRFHASMSSAVGALVVANLQIMSAGTEVSLLMEDAQKPRVLRGLFDAFYGDMDDKPVIFDTNRHWCARLPLLMDLFPGARVIACVRDVPWIMDSLERLIRQNPYENTKLFSNDAERGTVFSRMEALARPDRMIGFAWSALKEAYYSEHAGSLLVVEYELLTKAPDKVLALIYQFVDEPWYDGHDFEHVDYAAEHFDAALGLAGLHRVRPKVEFRPRKTILPPDLFARYQGMDFWRELAGSGAHVITLKQPMAADGASQTDPTG